MKDRTVSFEINDSMKSKDILTTALAYAGAGLPIFPVYGIKNKKCLCGKKDCPNAGKHPITRNGFKDATTDIKQIRKWLKEHPNANIGSPLIKGLSVIDVDGDEGKKSARNIGLTKLKTLKVKTSRGYHKYVHADLETKIGALKGIDIKQGAGNGYVILPPSTHASGVRYKWGVKNEVSSLPAKIYQQLFKPNRVKKANEQSSLIGEGGRNTSVFRFACSLKRMDCDERFISQTVRLYNQEKCSPSLSDGEIESVLKSVFSYQGNEELFGCMSDVEAKEIEWLWEPYIPKGCLTIIDGNPGDGKSTLTMELSAIITKGRKWPFSEKRTETGRVIILSAEDDPSRVMKPRLMAAQANDKHVYHMTQYKALNEDVLLELERKVEEIKPALIIIDNLTAYTGGERDMNRANQMVEFLTNINEIAQKYNTSIVLIQHLRKNNEGDALHQGLGSIGITARVRSMLRLGKYPDDINKKALIHYKSNYAKLGQSLIFSLETEADNSAPSIHWDMTSDITADDLNRSNPVGRPNEQNYLENDIRSFLQKHKKASVGELEKQLGASPSSIRRSLHSIKAHQIGKGPAVKWQL